MNYIYVLNPGFTATAEGKAVFFELDIETKFLRLIEMTYENRQTFHIRK